MRADKPGKSTVAPPKPLTEVEVVVARPRSPEEQQQIRANADGSLSRAPLGLSVIGMGLAAHSATEAAQLEFQANPPLHQESAGAADAPKAAGIAAASLAVEGVPVAALAAVDASWVRETAAPALEVDLQTASLEAGAQISFSPPLGGNDHAGAGDVDVVVATSATLPTAPQVSISMGVSAPEDHMPPAASPAVLEANRPTAMPSRPSGVITALLPPIVAIQDTVLDPLLGESVVDALLEPLLGGGGLVGSILDPLLGQDGVLGDLIGSISETILDPLLGDGGLFDPLISEGGLVGSILDPLLGQDGVLGDLIGSISETLLEPTLGQDGLLGAVLTPLLGGDGLVGAVLESVLGEGGVLGAVSGSLLEPLLGQDGILGLGVGPLLGNCSLDSVVPPLLGAVTDSVLEPLLGAGGLVDAVLDPLLDTVTDTLVDPLLGAEGVLGLVLTPLLGEGGILEAVVDPLLGTVSDSLINPLLGADGVLGGGLGQVLDADSPLGGALHVIQDGVIAPLLGQEGILSAPVGELLGEGSLIDTIISPILGENGLLGTVTDSLLTPIVGPDSVLADVLSPILGEEGLLGGLVGAIQETILEPLIGQNSGLGTITTPLLGEGSLLGGGLAPLVSPGGLLGGLSGLFSWGRSSSSSAASARAATNTTETSASVMAAAAPVVAAAATMVPTDAPPAQDAPVPQPLAARVFDSALDVQSVSALGADAPLVATADIALVADDGFLESLLMGGYLPQGAEVSPLDSLGISAELLFDNLFSDADGFGADDLLSLGDDPITDLMSGLGLSGAFAQDVGHVVPTNAVMGFDHEVDGLLNEIIDSGDRVVEGVTDPLSELLDLQSDELGVAGLFVEHAQVEHALDALFADETVNLDAEVAYATYGRVVPQLVPLSGEEENA